MKRILLLLLIAAHARAFAQQDPVFAVTDSLPANYDGLKAGYTIVERSEKEVGDKGNFSRYKIKFFVTNTSSEAKIFLKKSEFLNQGGASHYLANFKCSNATGARLTSKTVFIEMKSCVIEATVEDKECGTDKTNKNQRMVDVGYWVKPNETISTNVIMITPLNELPNMTVTFYPFNNGIIGNVSNRDISSNNNSKSFVRLKSFTGNYYLHTQNGNTVNCGTIDMDWWSAQWEIIPVNGTSNFQVQNRWTHNFISTENNTLLSENGQDAKAMWTIEATNTGNTYYIKNAADNSKLVLQNGVVKATSSYISTEATALWIIEK
jgi:hypothetical protein